MKFTADTYGVVNFNSIKVRLEPSLIDSSAGVGLFQFHKGTIRTVDAVDFLASLCLFQFHKGTIRTIVVFRYWIMLIYFNSIKVRLELFGVWQEIGRLSFQFHKGTIRTQYSEDAKQFSKISIP